MPRLLVVDDDELLCLALTTGLRRHDVDAEFAATAEAARRRLTSPGIEIVLIDVFLAADDGIALCGELASRWPQLDVVAMSGIATIDRAVAAVRAGALDFVTKPFDLGQLARRLLQIHARRRPARAAADTFAELLGDSAQMVSTRALLRRAAASDATILITGESGTGKELAARGLHGAGRRSAGPFVAINCAALPEALLEGELFGHVRGAFTDARHDRPGLFRRADRGVVFLDEIGELPRPLQPKLLRVLEERAFRPLGGDAEQPVDVRVIAATHRDLADEVAAGRFRADLFYRLNVLRVTMPPLRDRRDDIPALCARLLEDAARREGRPTPSLTEAAAAALRALPWPGNVRELRNALEHALAMAAGPTIDVGDLPAPAPELAPTAPPPLPTAPDPGAPWPTLAHLTARYIEAVLTHVGGNQSAAARVLGIDRRTLTRHLAARRTAPTPYASRK